MAKSYIESLMSDREKIVLVTRQHWFTLARAITVEVISILIIFAAAIFAAISNPLLAVLISAIGFLILLIPIATMTIDVLNWSNKQFIITNRRVIQISGIFNKNVTDSNLEKVNDVKMEQTVMGRLFGYGDIEILTASELGINLFKRIDEPIRFKTAMLNAKELMDSGITSVADENPAGDIPEMISRLDALRQKGILTEEEFQMKKGELLSKL
jgi:uncharacterized membrane protein YdbT with pleckstrin-like domain